MMRVPALRLLFKARPWRSLKSCGSACGVHPKSPGLRLVALVVPLALLAACGSAPKRETPATPKPPGSATAPTKPSYYSDDGPPESIPVDLARIPDAMPADEPFHRGSQRPYTVFGRTYVPIINNDPFRQTGIASWYGRKFHGQKTATGETYDMFAMSAAHPTLPLPSYARVTNLDNQKSVVVRVNDRGPFLHERIIDLSYAAAHRIGIAGPGSGRVMIERVFPGQVLQVAAASPNPPAGGTSVSTPARPPSTLVAVTPIPSTPALPAPTPLPDVLPGTGTGTTSASVTGSPTTPVARPSTAPAPITPAPAVAVVTVPTPTPPVVQTAPTPITTEGQGFYIQLGAFGSAENANQFRDRMRRDMNWMRDPIGVTFASGLHRVRIGPFSQRDEAEAIAAKVRETHGITPLISKPGG
jgi:rare lipoprotein A